VNGILADGSRERKDKGHHRGSRKNGKKYKENTDKDGQ